MILRRAIFADLYYLAVKHNNCVFCKYIQAMDIHTHNRLQQLLSNSKATLAIQLESFLDNNRKRKMAVTNLLACSDI